MFGIIYWQVYYMIDKYYDILVVGGGHAGVEAVWVGTQLGLSVALITMDKRKIGTMSCNPAIGGLAKGQIVREIDALGGLMGRAIDATGIQFRMLNLSRGAAVHGPRAQADKYAYASEVQRLLSTKPIDIYQALVDELIIENDKCVGLLASPITSQIINQDAVTSDYLNFRAEAVVLTTGTFMRALMHTGEIRTEGGRIGEKAAGSISRSLKKLGFELGRLKTGTPPRLDGTTIDFDSLPPQYGDAKILPFSELSPHNLPNGKFPVLKQVCCYNTSTNEQIHDIIRANLDRAPMYTGQITADCGPRYCPSIEDKIVRFADRNSHHVFLEPESLNTNEIYCNGISTSLPRDVQDQIVPLIPGCANARIIQYGYAVEYDMVWPHQIDSTCMTKKFEGLFLAGQINGTSGYEEAAGQGLVAGLNAGRYVMGQVLHRLGRETCYIGVMLDDLVTKTPKEPYRMFTSRAEYRLQLRSDNAPDRLTPVGRELGLIGEQRWKLYCERLKVIKAVSNEFDNINYEGRSIREVARGGQTGIECIPEQLYSRYDPRLIEVAFNNCRYENYIIRQDGEIKRLSEQENRRIPAVFQFNLVQGLRNEAVDVLSRFQPATLGQAGRLAGVNPADITLLALAIDANKRKKSNYDYG